MRHSGKTCTHTEHAQISFLLFSAHESNMHFHKCLHVAYTAVGRIGNSWVILASRGILQATPWVQGTTLLYFFPGSLGTNNSSPTPPRVVFFGSPWCLSSSVNKCDRAHAQATSASPWTLPLARSVGIRPDRGGGEGVKGQGHVTQDTHPASADFQHPGTPGWGHALQLA